MHTELSDIENSQYQNLAALAAFVLDSDTASLYQMCGDIAAVLVGGKPARVLCSHPIECENVRAHILAYAGEERDALLTVSSKPFDLLGQEGVVFEVPRSQARRVSVAVMELVIL